MKSEEEAQQLNRTLRTVLPVIYLILVSPSSVSPLFRAAMLFNAVGLITAKCVQDLVYGGRRYWLCGMPVRNAVTMVAASLWWLVAVFTLSIVSAILLILGVVSLAG